MMAVGGARWSAAVVAAALVLGLMLVAGAEARTVAPTGSAVGLRQIESTSTPTAVALDPAATPMATEPEMPMGDETDPDAGAPEASGTPTGGGPASRPTSSGAAPRATPPPLSCEPLRFGTDFQAGALIGEAASFTSLRRVYGAVTCVGVRGGTRGASVWSANGQIVNDRRSYNITMAGTGIWTTPRTFPIFYDDGRGALLKPGNWEAQYFIDDKLVTSGTFTIR